MIYIVQELIYHEIEGARVTQSQLQGRRSTYPYCQACLPRQGESHPDTGQSLQSCIFIVHSPTKGYSPAVRIPPNPGLPQYPPNQASMTMSPARRLSSTLQGEFFSIFQ